MFEKCCQIIVCLNQNYLKNAVDVVEYLYYSLKIQSYPTSLLYERYLLGLEHKRCFRPTHYLAEPVCVELSAARTAGTECFLECAITLNLPGNPI